MKKSMLTAHGIPVLVLLMLSAPLPQGYAEALRNGNELALSYSTNNTAGKIAFAKSAAGILCTFRYLKVTEIKLDAPQEGAATLTAVEPSSALTIKMIIATPLSLEIVNSLQPGECVAIKGRVKNIGAEGTNLLVLDPAIINHKDRKAPKLSKELLREVDPNAY